MSAKNEVNVTNAALDIICGLRNTGEAYGISWAWDTVKRWMERDGQVPHGMTIVMSGFGESVRYSFAKRAW